MTILKRSENVCDNDSVSLDKNTSLVLRKVAPSDSGIYKCFFRAKAGRNNCHTLFRLNISGISLLINSENEHIYNFCIMYFGGEIHKTYSFGKFPVPK